MALHVKIKVKSLASTPKLRPLSYLPKGLKLHVTLFAQRVHARKEYEQTKQSIFANGINEQEAYGALKSPFVKSILNQTTLREG